MSLNWQLGRKTIQGTGLADMGRATASLKYESNSHATDVVEGFDLTSGINCVSFNGQVQASLPVFFYKYDFATDGGAIGAITLRGVGKLAAKNALFYAGTWVNTALTSGGSATVSIGCAGSAANLLAATAIGTMGTAGGHALIPIQATPSTWVDSGSTDQDVTITIATAALTAGSFTLVIFGIPYTTDTSV